MSPGYKSIEEMSKIRSDIPDQDARLAYNIMIMSGNQGLSQCSGQPELHCVACFRASGDIWDFWDIYDI